MQQLSVSSQEKGVDTLKRHSITAAQWTWLPVAAFVAIVGCLLTTGQVLQAPAAMAAGPSAPVERTVADCTPEKITARASPVVLANVLYTAFPAGLRPRNGGRPPGGRMAAVRIYDPEIPDQTLTGDQILWEAGQVLATGNPDQRRILFAREGVLTPFTPRTVTSDMLALGKDTSGSASMRCDFTGDGSIDGDDVAWLIQWVRRPLRKGSGRWENWHWPLGAVDQSVPALVVPPRMSVDGSGPTKERTSRQRYRRFSDVHRNRRSVLFVGSADGLLHAFDAGSFRWGDNPATAGIREQRGYFRWEPAASDAPDYCFDYDGRCPDYGTGKELWAFIPSNLLPRLKFHLLGDGEPASMNASPAVADVYLDTDQDGIVDTWRTVLVSSQGTGGSGLFCLDVTDPHQPALMWETTDEALVRRQAAPATVRIGRHLDPATGRPRWVVFVVSGTSGAAQDFPAVMIFDISTGRLWKRIVLDAAVDRNRDGQLQRDERNFGSGGVAGSRPAIVDSDGNGMIDRIYVSSNKGLVYKILLPDEPEHAAAGIQHCVLNTDFSAADGRTVPVDRRYQPIQASPTVWNHIDGTTGEDSRRRVWVFFGTGGDTLREERTVAADHPHVFFAYTDDAGKLDCRPDRHALQWFVELAPGEHVLASAFAAAGQVYVGTTATIRSDPCGRFPVPSVEPGSLITVDIQGTVIFERSIPDILSPPLVEDMHLYITLPGGPLSLGDGVYNHSLPATGKPKVRIKAWQPVE